jgi:UDP-glucose 4-epimerase
VTTATVNARSKVLVTGATGFVGRALVSHLLLHSHKVRSVVRRRFGEALPRGDVFAVGNLTDSIDWSAALQGVDVIVHVAARTQALRSQTQEGAMAEFRAVNVAATVALAAQALAAGVRRFVFISSIKVLGESSPLGHPLGAESPYAPEDAYAISKMEAEQGLLELLNGSSMELVIVRPPLVFGPGMQSNFGALMGAVKRRFPMPFASIDNRRSFISIDNLVDFIRVCIAHPKASAQIWLVSDEEVLSTPELVRRMAAALNVHAWLLPFPASLLRWGAGLVGKGPTLQRLCGNLELDIAPARQLLGWTPPVALEDGLRRAVNERVKP